MNRHQKLFLGVFAALDLVVVAALGAVAYRGSRPAVQPVPSPTVAFETWACAEQVTLPLAEGAAPVLAWSAQRMTIQVTLQATAPATDTVQLLWLLLDRLAEARGAGCTLPPEVVLQLTAADPRLIETHTAVVPAAELERWAAGETTDAELAQLARYLRITAAAPGPDPPAHPR